MFVLDTSGGGPIAVPRLSSSPLPFRHPLQPWLLPSLPPLVLVSCRSAAASGPQTQVRLSE